MAFALETMVSDAIKGVSQAISGLEVSTERLREIANSAVAPTEEHARTNTAGFRSLSVPVSAFSEVPAAQALGTQHSAAHDVLRETILGVLQDLEDFRDNLVASANAHQRTDEGAQQAMLAVSQKYAHHSYHSDQNYDSSRRSEGGNLDGPSGDDTPQSTQPTTSAAPASAPSTPDGY